MNSVLLAIAAFQRYITKNSPLKGINIHDKQLFPTLNTLLNGKFKWLSAKGKGEMKGSESLTVDECLHILKHNYILDDKSNHKITNQSGSILMNATMQVANITPTFQIAKQILQDSQFNNIKNNESITLSTTSSHELFEEFNKSSQGNIYNNNNSNVTYHIHHKYYYFTLPSQ
ncbi:zinc finger mym-type protein 2-like: PROVISIONAL [Gigaspora margarita]|uniref:Zinc finger mym-type protein 2-like: PROVISIONAL n=1 Tax=Gigaspora margarita TaxID=4874 RepID=A0A8H3XJE1_GIGMA|nr:zinc finger mym-type protein 2-like: PROVISIONAL [Gigaspora margarita]